MVEVRPYDLEEFKKVTLDVLKKHPLAEYIAEEVWAASKSKRPNVRDCVRLAYICKTEQDVLRTLRILGSSQSPGAIRLIKPSFWRAVTLRHHTVSPRMFRRLLAPLPPRETMS